MILAAAVLPGCHYDEYAVSPSPAVFTIRELGLLPGGTQSQANAGSSAALVGWGILAGTAHHAVTFSGGQAHALQEPAGATNSEARGVNAGGAIVGFATVGGVRQGLVWSGAGAAQIVLSSLDTVPGEYSFARAINNQGVVLGQAQDTLGDTVIVVWRPTIEGAYEDPERLDPVEGAGFAPTAINELDQVAGNASDSSAEPGGFLWDGVEFVTIEPPGSNGATDANGLNNFGVMVGAFTTASVHSRAFLYTRPIAAFQLGGPPTGYTEVEANAVNDSGRVSGNAFTVDNLQNTLTSVPLIGTMIDSVHTFTALPTLGGSLAKPSDNAITPCGVVLGWATKSASPTLRYAVAWVPQGCTIP